MSHKLRILLILLLFHYCVLSYAKNQPNIIIIISDDMGFNDVGFHGSDQIPTPNIDALGYNGIILNRYYVQPLCTPSRAALMTGKYPINTGMQTNVIIADEPWGLPLQEKLLSEYLQENGYKTHLVGKWHLGFYRKAYTPTMRGFDSHLGCFSGLIDYFDHTFRNNYTSGYDMRQNLSVNYDANGTYATELFTNAAVDIIKKHDKNTPLFLDISYTAPHSGNSDDPFQAPFAEVEQFNYIKDEKRRTYAAMVSIMDRGIGKVVKTLNDQNMLNNSIILFFSDNGAATVGIYSNSGSNFPFKGQKASPWEGGVRSAAAIWSPLLNNQQRVSNQLIHITDWLPTLLDLVGINTNQSFDGKNIWNMLSNDGKDIRSDLVINIDPISKYSSLIYDEFKYVHGTIRNGIYDVWMGKVNNTEIHPSFLNYSESILTSDVSIAISSLDNYNKKNDKTDTSLGQHKIQKLRTKATVICPQFANPSKCNSYEAACLFNIIEDPCEINNIANFNPDIMRNIKKKLQEYEERSVPPRNRPSDVRSDPRNFNNTWTWWWDELDLINNY